jgi:transcriptional regulator with XRE-family HTH domain
MVFNETFPMKKTCAPLRRLVRALRLANGWTQERFAERAGVDYKYYQLFEAGRTPEPSLKWIGAVAAALGVKPWLLLCDEPELVQARTGIPLARKDPPRRTGRPRKLDGETR